MELLFATTNPHKVRELKEIMRSAGIEVVGLDAPGVNVAGPEPREDGRTFAENARLKALHYARAAGRPCLAEDSGLEVDALGGAPGVRSARWAGRGATRAERDRANNSKLLEELRGVERQKRTARFVCAMCLADAAGSVLAETRGTFEGIIADAPAGGNGFGYDPLLFVPEEGCTAAELPPQRKNALSHRGQAARAMAGRLALLRRALGAIP
jgi:XTP/dITP diphosphohydrolase